MSFNPSDPDIAFALESVEQAAELVALVRKEMSGFSLTKKDRSPVTVADLGVQALVAALLSERFPDDPLVAEESSAVFRTAEGKNALEQVTGYVRRWRKEAVQDAVVRWIDRGNGEPKGRFWALDPIDGTKGFLRGGQYAVALALVEDGQIKIGVLACPELQQGISPENSGTLAIAVKGHGSWHASLKKKNAFCPMNISGRKNPAEAVMLRSFENAHTDSEQTEKLVRQLGVTKEPILMDSLAKYAVLAAGNADLLVRFPLAGGDPPGEWLWDLAAGAILVEEAGGRVTDIDGQKLDLSRGRRLSANRGVLATNGHLHPACLQAIRRQS